VSRAWQVPSTVSGLREAMAAQVRAGQGDRVPEPAVEKTYGIQAVTNRIDDIYVRLADQRKAGARAGGRGRRARGNWPDRVTAGAGRDAGPAEPVANGHEPDLPADESPAAPVPGTVLARPAPEASQG
jgi:hypothetical protein